MGREKKEITGPSSKGVYQVVPNHFCQMHFCSLCDTGNSDARCKLAGKQIFEVRKKVQSTTGAAGGTSEKQARQRADLEDWQTFLEGTKNTAQIVLLDGPNEHEEIF